MKVSDKVWELMKIKARFGTKNAFLFEARIQFRDLNSNRNLSLYVGEKISNRKSSQLTFILI